MKKNGWFFGDSFTSGHGLNFDYDIKKLNIMNKYYKYNEIETLPNHIWDNPPLLKYKDFKENHQFSIWPHLMCKHYDLNYNNEGISGGSNEEILFSILPQLKNINEGDYVFIGLTNPNRIMIPFNGDIFDNPLISSGINWVDNKTNGVTGLEHSKNNLYTEDDKEVIVNFLHDIVLKNEKNYISYFLKMFTNLQEYFIEKNITCIIWGFLLWSQFENIKKWTDGKVNDLHWSPKGHNDFFNFMISKIEKGVIFIDNERTLI